MHIIYVRGLLHETLIPWIYCGIGMTFENLTCGFIWTLKLKLQKYSHKLALFCAEELERMYYLI